MELELEHRGKVALFHEGRLCGTFRDQEQAYIHGEKTYGSGTYCIFPIGRERVFNIGVLGALIDGSKVPAGRASEEDEMNQQRKHSTSHGSDEARSV